MLETTLARSVSPFNVSTDHTQRRVTSLNSYYPHRAPPHPLHPLECSFLHSWYPDLAPPPPNCPCPTEFAKRSREPQPHRLRFPGPLRHFAKFAKLAKLKKTKKTPGKIENQFGENSRQNEFQFGENSRQNAVSPNWVSPNWGSPICPTHPPEPPQEQQALMLWQGQSSAETGQSSSSQKQPSSSAADCASTMVGLSWIYADGQITRTGETTQICQGPN